MVTGSMEPVGVTLGYSAESDPSEASSSTPSLPKVETEERSTWKDAGRDVIKTASSASAQWKPTLSSIPKFTNSEESNATSTSKLLHQKH